MITPDYTHRIFCGDNMATLRELPDNSIDAVVTDAPYGLGKEPDAAETLQAWITTGAHEIKGAGFMGKTWDAFVPQPALWKEVYRVLKPGGHLLSFFGTRTYDWGTLAIRLAGFEIRDMIAWVYGSGFPKSLDVSKAIDKAAGAEREVLRVERRYNEPSGIVSAGRDERVMFDRKVTAPATDDAKKWEGWGTALKPAHEPICVARKPLTGTVADNVLTHGVGAINVDGCRVEAPEGSVVRMSHFESGSARGYEGGLKGGARVEPHTNGRWPANLIHDGSDEVCALFPHTVSGSGNKNVQNHSDNNVFGKGLGAGKGDGIGGDSGSAARFFYCAKASKADRGEGNTHPTVKPTDLMRYLVRLVTPAGGVVLDPFAGSGSTGKACVLEGFGFIGLELERSSCDIAEARIAAAVDSLIEDLF